jgi:Signal transduction histidine kinase regulating citrate/malate metabolism
MSKIFALSLEMHWTMQLNVFPSLIDPEKRLITLSMYQKNQLLMIQCENYTETSLSLKPDQLPTTTKQNAGYHGYGLKSIQQAARKYGGSMTLHAEDNWFTLQVLIPVES